MTSGLLGIASILLLLLTFPLVITLANVTNLGIWLLVPWYLLTAIAFGGGGSAISLAFALPSQGTLGHHGPCHRHHRPAWRSDLRRVRDVPLSLWNELFDLV